jgi:hypothetical protein
VENDLESFDFLKIRSGLGFEFLYLSRAGVYYGFGWLQRTDGLSIGTT